MKYINKLIPANGGCRYNAGIRRINRLYYQIWRQGVPV
jgi:hypothetical protein